MVYLRIVVVTTCLFFEINAYNIKMKEHYDCTRFLNRTRLVSHADLCLITTKCTEHVIRYQTTIDIAIQHISCCKAYQLHYVASHCTLNCKIRCDKYHPKCENKANQCDCHPNYKLHPSLDICIPQCPTTCPNNKCTKPNVCDCPEGYNLSDTQTECIPECPNTCENGYCPYPNQCTCLPGYHRGTISDGCVPDCFDSCISSNGTCSRIPNVCECANKFDKVTRKCIECAGGYYFDTRRQVCRPKCDTGCVNGFCTAPNQCRCRVGYMVNNKTGICEPKLKRDVEVTEENLAFARATEDDLYEPVLGASGPLLTGDDQYPWLIIFCTAALIASVLLVGVETWVHKMCNRTLEVQPDDNDYLNEVQYRWVNNNLYVQKITQS